MQLSTRCDKEEGLQQGRPAVTQGHRAPSAVLILAATAWRGAEQAVLNGWHWIVLKFLNKLAAFLDS